jgi:uncharacterized protein (TIGR02448 family)
LNNKIIAFVLLSFSQLSFAQGYTNSSISSAQTYYMTLLGPTAASNASTQMDRLGQRTQDDSLAFIATEGEISGPALELAYQNAHALNPSVTRKDVALSLAAR